MKQTIFFIILIVIILASSTLYFIYRADTAGGIYFDKTVSAEEQAKITSDINSEFQNEFNDGFRMEVYKESLPNCNLGDKCNILRVKYIYNQYGDNASGIIELKDGKYIFSPSL